MASNPKSTFETSMDKTNLILKDIEQAYGWPRERRNQSYLALRTVLHLLRDRLPVEESGACTTRAGTRPWCRSS